MCPLCMWAREEDRLGKEGGGLRWRRKELGGAGKPSGKQESLASGWPGEEIWPTDVLEI